MRKRTIGLVAGLVAVTATALLATVGTAGTSKAHAGYKIFILPKATGIPVFTQNGLGPSSRARSSATR
jgi:hypothetical protein